MTDSPTPPNIIQADRDLVELLASAIERSQHLADKSIADHLRAGFLNMVSVSAAMRALAASQSEARRKALALAADLAETVGGTKSRPYGGRAVAKDIATAIRNLIDKEEGR
jgi:hypothetical protein